MNLDDSIAQRVAELIWAHTAELAARHAARVDEIEVRAMVAEVERCSAPGFVTLEQWQVQRLEQHFGLGPDGEDDHGGLVFIHPRRNARARRFRELLRIAGFEVPDSPAEPAPEDARERALRLRRTRNTGPTTQQRSPRRIPPRGHR